MLFKVTGYPDEENIYHQHHTKIETWIVNAKDKDEALKLGCQHFYYFHEIGVDEYKEPKIRLKVGDKIKVQRSNDITDIVDAVITKIDPDGEARYEWSRPCTGWGSITTITSEEILYRWQLEQGRVLEVNGRSVRPEVK